MRCNNCGWTNPDGVVKCQKCNQPLTGAEPTVNKESADSHKDDVASVKCTKCGYPVANEWSMCPNCGAQVGNTPIVDKHTEDVWNNSRKTLVLDQLTVAQNGEDAVSQDTMPTPQPISKATVIANPSDVGVAEKKQATELNKTVLEPIRSKASNDTRKTVVDTEDYVSSISKPIVADKSEKKDYSYSLSCMDGDASINIELKSSSELAVKKGDVVLIGGLRYRVS